MADDGVELSPDKVLTFTWDTGADTPQAVLRAANGNPNKYFVYKVKTTAPKRYVVRPPQGCLEPSCHASIKLTMVAKDAEALWAEAWEEQRQGLAGDVKCDDKFLVQTAEVSAAYYEQELKGKDDKALSATLAKLWKQLGEEDKAGGALTKKKVKSAKLTTKFVFPKAMNQTAQSSTPAAAAPTAAAPPAPAAAAAAAPPASFVADKNSPLVAHAAAPAPDALFAEFSALRKKYDDLVAYTVVLTGERDFLQQDCKDKEESLKKAEAAAKAAAAAAPAAAKAAGAAGGGGVVVKEATGPAGMAFSQVIAVALLAFVVGRILA